MRSLITLCESSVRHHNNVEAYLSKGRIPRFLAGLAAEARKAGSMKNFEQDYCAQIKHGIYWHLTTDPNFRIDLNKGPRDMSSMASGAMTPGALMVTSHLENWEAYYEGSREYAALIDMSAVPRNGYYQVSRGFGNEFYVPDASQAKVRAVMPLKQAKRLGARWHAYLPNSFDELRRFYELATGAANNGAAPK